jgi:putative transposase
MCRQNPGWGAPRIHGELLKLGVDVAESSVSKYVVRCRKPPSQTWRTFLDNHLTQLVSIDFFTVPTIRLHVLYVFLVLAHDRRRILHFNVTAHPTAVDGAATAGGLSLWPAPAYLLRDRDAIFGLDFREQVRDLGIQEVLSTPRSPWQRAYVERVIGSIRRECLDHVIVFHEASLRRTLNLYFDYYHRSRTHLSLAKDSPEPRPVQPPELGRVVAVSQVGGLHHRYERRAAWKIPNLPCYELCLLAVWNLSPNRVPSHTRASANLHSPASSRSANCLSFAIRLGKCHPYQRAQSFR